MILLLSTWFVLCSVSDTANEYSIYHFCIIIKDFFISFSMVIIAQDIKTVNFCVLFVYRPTFSVIFCKIKINAGGGGPTTPTLV